MNQVNVHIRWMIRADMPEVLQIERDSYSEPMEEQDFLKLLRDSNVIGSVAEHCSQVVGYMIYELRKTSLQICTLTVAPDWRRRGVGQQMIWKLMSKLSAGRRTRLTLEVRESNLAAQLFARQLGFRAEKVIRGHYSDTKEDAFVMVYRFGCDAPVNRVRMIEGQTQGGLGC